jgi:hypothetical protein
LEASIARFAVIGIELKDGLRVSLPIRTPDGIEPIGALREAASLGTDAELAAERSVLFVDNTGFLRFGRRSQLRTMDDEKAANGCD